MATDQDDSDIPESGGVFTFGKSRFAENLPNKFWIRNDEVKQVACGDEHTVLLAETGRVFVFGDNSYGQLGLGNTKPQNKPSCVKSLKGESVSIIGCGKSHTLIGTSSGQLYSFGSNSDHQCALDMDGSVETPTEVLLDKPIVFKQLSGGSSHSVGLDNSHNVWVWGDNTEGQLGLGDGVSEVEKPTKLKLDDKPVHISCGYYHTAIVTASGDLYTFGESESGKLGHGEGVLALEPLEVEIPEKVVWASCGGRHTVAVTAKGTVYAFGDGSSGQLGLGTNELESSTPTQLNLKNMKVKYSACGENFTSLITEKGQMYTFGDGRHGKLALGAENFTNQFRPFRVPRFSKFKVTKVSCGGCHTIALAHKSDTIEEEEEEVEDPLNSTFANSLRLSTDADLSASISARDRRRAKEPAADQTLSRTLPPLTSSARGLPPLTASKLKPLDSAKLPSTLDKRKLPEAKFSQDYSKNHDEASDSDVSVTPEGSSEEEEEEQSPVNLKSKREAMKKQSAKIANGRGKPLPVKKPNSRSQREDDEESEESEEEKTTTKSSKKKGAQKSPMKKIAESDEEDSEQEDRRTSKTVAAKNKKNKSKSRLADSDDEEADSALEDSEEETTTKSKNRKNDTSKSSKDKKKKKSALDSEEEGSEADERKASKSKTDPKKSKFSLFGSKNKKASLEESEDDDEEEEEEEPEEKPKKSKGKDNKASKDKKKTEDSEEENEDDDENAGGDTKKKGDKSDSKDKKDAEEKPPEEKKSRACIIL